VRVFSSVPLRGARIDLIFCVVGGIFTRGPGLSFVEATAVTPEGRITAYDLGLWKDEQIAPLKQVRNRGTTCGF
jgi:hypothetical protein